MLERMEADGGKIAVLTSEDVKAELDSLQKQLDEQSPSHEQT